MQCSIAVFFLCSYLSTCIVTSDYVVKWLETMIFSWILMVTSVIYNILSPDNPNRVWHIETCVHYVLLVIFPHRSEQGKVHPGVSLINQALVIHSFTILQRFAQLYFTPVILDSGDSRKWLITSLNRLLYWKVEFQSLLLFSIQLNLNFFSEKWIYVINKHWISNHSTLKRWHSKQSGKWYSIISGKYMFQPPFLKVKFLFSWSVPLEKENLTFQLYFTTTSPLH